MRPFQNSVSLETRYWAQWGGVCFGGPFFFLFLHFSIKYFYGQIGGFFFLSLIWYIWALSKNSVTVFRVSAFYLWGKEKSLISINQMCLLPRETASWKSASSSQFKTMAATIRCCPCPLSKIDKFHLKIGRAAQSRTEHCANPWLKWKGAFDNGEMWLKGQLPLIHLCDVSWDFLLFFSLYLFFPYTQSPRRQDVR